MREEIQKTVDVLRAGGTILYPTDTIWGLGCDATNYRAIQKIFKIKKRTQLRSLIILLDNVDKLTDYVVEVPAIAYDLLNVVKKPLTVIYPKAKNLPKNVIDKDGSIAIRIPHHDFCKRLINKFNKPIVSTSANFSGAGTNLFFSKISHRIKDDVDYIVNLYQDTVKEIKPSTIIKFINDSEYIFLRK